MRPVHTLLLSICFVAAMASVPAHAGKLICAPVCLLPSPFARCPMNKQAAKYFREAEKRGRDGNIEGSIECYSQVLILDPQNSSVYEARGTARLIRRQYLDALADFDKSISIDSRNYVSFSGRGSAKLYLNDKSGALKDFDAAVRLSPKDSSLYNSRSDVRFELGDSTGALADANKAVTLEPSSGWVYYRRSRLLAQIGDRTGALRDFRKACSLDSRFNNSRIPRYISGH